MAGMKSYIGRKCCTFNLFVKNLLLNVSGDSPLTGTCYVFQFVIASIDELLQSFIYNDGNSAVEFSISLDPAVLTEQEIADQIKAEFDTADPVIIYDDILVSRIDVGGGSWRYNITIQNPDYDITVVDVEGNSYESTITDCT